MGNHSSNTRSNSKIQWPHCFYDTFKQLPSTSHEFKIPMCTSKYPKEVMMVIFKKINTISFIGFIAPQVCQEWYSISLEDELWCNFLNAKTKNEKFSTVRDEVFDIWKNSLLVLPDLYQNKTYTLARYGVHVTLVGNNGVGMINLKKDNPNFSLFFLFFNRFLYFIHNLRKNLSRSPLHQRLTCSYDNYFLFPISYFLFFHLYFICKLSIYLFIYLFLDLNFQIH